MGSPNVQRLNELPVAPIAGSGSLRSELTEEARIIGSHEFLNEASKVVEPEDIHEVPDDPGSRGFQGTCGRLHERTNKGALNPGLAHDEIALSINDPSSNAAVVKGLSNRPEVLRQTFVVGVEPVRPVELEVLSVEIRVGVTAQPGISPMRRCISSGERSSTWEAKLHR